VFPVVSMLALLLGVLALSEDGTRPTNDVDESTRSSSTLSHAVPLALKAANDTLTASELPVFAARCETLGALNMLGGKSDLVTDLGSATRLQLIALKQQCDKISDMKSFQTNTEHLQTITDETSGQEKQAKEQTSKAEGKQEKEAPTEVVTPCQGGGTWETSPWLTLQCDGGNGALSKVEYRTCKCTSGAALARDCTSPNANDLGKETTNVGWRAEFSAEDSNPTPENFEANSKKMLADCSKSFIEKYRVDAEVRVDEERQAASEELQQLDALASASGSVHPCASCYPGSSHGSSSSATCQDQKCEDWSIPAGHRLVSCTSTHEGVSDMDCDGFKSELEKAAKAHFKDQVDTGCEAIRKVTIADKFVSNIITTTPKQPGPGDLGPLGVRERDRSGNIYWKIMKLGCCGKYKMMMRVSVLEDLSSTQGKQLMWATGRGIGKWGNGGKLNNTDGEQFCPTNADFDDWVQKYMAEERHNIASKLNLFENREVMLGEQLAVPAITMGPGSHYWRSGTWTCVRRGTERWASCLTQMPVQGSFQWSTAHGSWDCSGSSKGSCSTGLLDLK